MTERIPPVDWARQHSWLSVHTLRRRFRLTAAEADQMIAEMVDGHVLGREPEGESYRVLYSRRRMERPDWFNPQPQSHAHKYRGGD